MTADLFFHWASRANHSIRWAISNLHTISLPYLNLDTRSVFRPITSLEICVCFLASPLKFNHLKDEDLSTIILHQPSHPFSSPPGCPHSSPPYNPILPSQATGSPRVPNPRSIRRQRLQLIVRIHFLIALGNSTTGVVRIYILLAVALGGTMVIVGGDVFGGEGYGCWLAAEHFGSQVGGIIVNNVNV